MIELQLILPIKKYQKVPENKHSNAVYPPIKNKIIKIPNLAKWNFILSFSFIIQSMRSVQKTPNIWNTFPKTPSPRWESIRCISGIDLENSCWAYVEYLWSRMRLCSKQCSEISFRIYFFRRITLNHKQYFIVVSSLIFIAFC